MLKINELDFKGTTIFCGLDVHKVGWRVNIRDNDFELKDYTYTMQCPQKKATQ